MADNRKPLGVEGIRDRVGHLREMSDRNDQVCSRAFLEAAQHAVWGEALTAIALGEGTAAEIAREALKTRDIYFGSIWT